MTLPPAEARATSRMQEEERSESEVMPRAQIGLGIRQFIGAFLPGMGVLTITWLSAVTQRPWKACMPFLGKEAKMGPGLYQQSMN